jgi:chlorite dismutase
MNEPASFEPRPVLPTEGLHVLHVFYQIDHAQWSLLSDEERREAKTEFSSLVQEIRSTPATQLLTFAMVGHKADLGLMLLTPDLQQANAFEKLLTQSLGPDLLQPAYSYLSMTERSEYTTTTEQHAESLQREQGLEPGSEAMAKAIAEFETRMEHYSRHRLYPQLPDWPVMCFYNMSKKREGADNWYSLDFETRRKLMAGHARTGKAYHGRILQLITGSTGLDDAEWGVTLLAHTTSDVKSIVYEMRFDEVSARYGVFGEFYIGLQLPLSELFHRLRL